jgi:hypothetical protein
MRSRKAIKHKIRQLQEDIAEMEEYPISCWVKREHMKQQILTLRWVLHRAKRGKR